MHSSWGSLCAIDLIAKNDASWLHCLPGTVPSCNLFYHKYLKASAVALPCVHVQDPMHSWRPKDYNKYPSMSDKLHSALLRTWMRWEAYRHLRTGCRVQNQVLTR